jgi:hypothetical protein
MDTPLLLLLLQIVDGVANKNSTNRQNKKLGAQTQNAPQVTKTHKQDAFKPEEYPQNKNKTKRRAASTAEAKAKRRAASIPEAELIKPNQNLQSTNKKADGDHHHHHKEEKEKKKKMTPPPNKAQDNKTEKPIILLPPVGSH